MKRVLMLVAMFVLAGNVLADSTQDHTCQGGHNCNDGSNSGSNTTTVTNTNQNANDVYSTNLSTNTNNNTNLVGSTSNATGGQGGNSQSTVLSTVNPVTHSSSSSVSSGGTATVGNTTSTSSVGSVGGGSVGNTSATSTGGSVVYQSNNQVAARAAAEVPAIINGNDQCRIGVAMGGSGVGFTFNVGGSTRDENCEIIKLSRELRSMGLPQAALALLMQDERVKKAVDQAYFKGLDKQGQ